MSPNLREEKRRATLAAIEESATKLVEERGYEAVTIDDICAAAHISRRTFFNYVDSKETAVMGQPPRELSEEDLLAFTQTNHDDLLAAVLELCFLIVPEAKSEGPGVSSLIRRRKAIKRDNPELAYARLRTFTVTHGQVHDAVESYLRNHPEARRLDCAIDREAAVIVSVAVQSLQLGYKQWALAGSTVTGSIADHSHEALALLKSLFSSEGTQS